MEIGGGYVFGVCTYSSAFTCGTAYIYVAISTPIRTCYCPSCTPFYTPLSSTSPGAHTRTHTRKMHLLTLSLSLLALLPPALTQGFSGRGHIAVWPSSDWSTATPSLKAGCLSASGALVPSTPASNCGVFTPLNVYPYTLSSSSGNCTFNDKSREQNTDSAYGRGDYGFYCAKGWVSEVYEELYVIVSLRLVLLLSAFCFPCSWPCLRLWRV